MDTSRSSRGAPSPKSHVASETVELQVQQFMDDWHYRVMSSSLGKAWTQRKAVTAALEIFRINGVPLEDQEVDELAAMEEGHMVSDVVDLLPKHLHDDFDHLALQLQMLLTTATRIRKAVDDGRPEDIQETIEETDSTSIGQQVLKQAIIEASKEVAAIYDRQDQWVKSMSTRVDRLTRSAEFAEHAQSQLLAVESQLETFNEEQSKKSRSALVNLADQSEKALLKGVVSSWYGMIQSGMGERQIKRKFEKQIADAEKALYDYKERRIRNVRKTLMRNARDTEFGLASFCIETWAALTRERKLDGTSKETMMALEAKIEAMAQRQSDSTKKVMARMGNGSDEMWVGMAFSAWVKFSEDYKKDKEFEDAVKKAERDFAAHCDKKKGDSQQMLNRMHSATANGLLSMVVVNWSRHTVEERKSREMESMMMRQGDKFKSMQSNAKNNASNVQGRVNEQVKANLLLRCLNAWGMESKVNHIEKYYTVKMNHKRQQLKSVQSLFKSFAKQLEEGLGNLDGPEDSARTRHKSRKGMTKDGGSVSLPEIHGGRGIRA